MRGEGENENVQGWGLPPGTADLDTRRVSGHTATWFSPQLTSCLISLPTDFNTLEESLLKDSFSGEGVAQG